MFFTISYVALWALVLVACVGVLVLGKQVGTLLIRVPPRTARMTNAGPDIGHQIESFKLVDLAGNDISIPSATGARQMIVFLSAGCRSCSKIAPALRTIQYEERELEIIFAGIGGSPAGHKGFAESHNLLDGYVNGTTLAARYSIWTAPYAMLIDHTGEVISKGVVNELEDINSLLQVADLPDDARLAWAKPLSTVMNSGENIQGKE